MVWKLLLPRKLVWKLPRGLTRKLVWKLPRGLTRKLVWKLVTRQQPQLTEAQLCVMQLRKL